MPHAILWALFGWGIASWVFMRIIWLPDPPPDAFGRFITTSIAGILGGVLAGVAVSASSDPMPILPVVGAVAGSLVLVAGLQALSPKRAGGR